LRGNLPQAKTALAENMHPHSRTHLGLLLKSPPTPPNVVKQIDKHRFQWPGPGVVSPRPISTPLPDMPDQIRTKSKVTLCIGINETGDVEQIQIVRSVSKAFDDFAVDSVNEWKFAPATKNGKPIPVFINVDVEAKKVDSKSRAVH
jgi:TonB family protein